MAVGNVERLDAAPDAVIVIVAVPLVIVVVMVIPVVIVGMTWAFGRIADFQNTILLLM